MSPRNPQMKIDIGTWLKVGGLLISVGACYQQLLTLKDSVASLSSKVDIVIATQARQDEAIQWLKKSSVDKSTGSNNIAAAQTISGSANETIIPFSSR